MTRLLSRNRTSALTLIELVVIIAILAVLVAMLFPRLAGAKAKHRRIGCENSLKQIGLAFRVWAGDQGGKFPMQVPEARGGTLEQISSGSPFPHFQVMSNELNTPRVLWCPEDKGRSETRSFETNFTRANISYFIGTDAEALRPAMFLVGDDHLAVDDIPLVAGLAQVWTNSPVSWRRGRHSYVGNVCLADGSVQSCSMSGLRDALMQTGVATNRLAMP